MSNNRITVKLENKQIRIYNSFDIKNFLKEKFFSYDANLKCWKKSAQNKNIILDLKELKTYIEKLFWIDNFTKSQIIKEIDDILINLNSQNDDFIDKLKDILFTYNNTQLIDDDLFNNITQDITPKNKNLKEYQKEFLRFALNKKYILLADEMGLGKTIQAISLINIIKAKNVLLITPAFLKYNWEVELKEWLTFNKHLIFRVNSKNLTKINFTFPGIYIINYELIEKLITHYKDIINHKFDMIILDEAHYIKNYEAKRTYNVLKLKANKYLFITGTPILNNITEILPILLKIYNDKLFELEYKQYIKEVNKIFIQFIDNFTYYENTKYGLKIKGSRNLDILRPVINSFMIRRIKKDVLHELPDKNRIIFYLDEETDKNLLDKELELWNILNKINTNKSNTDKEYDSSLILDDAEFDVNDIILNLTNKDYANLSLDEKIKLITYKINNNKDDNNSTYKNFILLRHLLGLKKINNLLEYTDNILEEYEHNNRLIIMTWFNDTANYIAKKIKQRYNCNVLLVTGQTKLEDRHKYVSYFQDTENNKNLTIFIGTIKACGVGLTLTASNIMIFNEISVVPADNIQAEDRIYRIGQKNNVDIHYLIYKNSLDENILKLLDKKTKEINKIL